MGIGFGAKLVEVHLLSSPSGYMLITSGFPLLFEVYFIDMILLSHVTEFRFYISFRHGPPLFYFYDKNLDNEETDAITNHINILNSASFPLQ